MQLAADVRKENLKRKQTLIYSKRNIDQQLETKATEPKPINRIGDILSTQQNGRELDLRNYVAGLTNDILWELGQELPQCVTINCAGWKDVTETCIRSISLGFGNRLETLDLSNSTVTNAILKTLSIRLFAIRTLKLSGCKFLTNQSCQAIAEGCGRTITNLDFSRCPKVDQGGAQWLSGTVGAGMPCKILQAISFSECARLSDVALEALAAGCIQLRYANFARCALVSDKGVVALAKGCSALRVLNVQHCDLVGDRSLAALGVHCPQLRSLNLAMCTRVSDGGLELLCRQKVSLQSINLAGCDKVSEKGVFFVLSKSKGMQMMNVTGCTLVTQRGLLEMLRGLPFVELADSFTGFKAKRAAPTLKLHAQVEVVESDASKRITALLRGVSTRARLRRQRREALEVTSATRLQGWYRGTRVRAGFAKLKQLKLETECAVRLQCAWRCRSARETRRQIPEQLEMLRSMGLIVVKVQAAFRSTKVRNQNPEVQRVKVTLFEQRKREVQSAITVRIQAISRQMFSNNRFRAQREEYQQRRRDMYLAAHRIQNLGRRFIAKLAVERQKEYNARRYSLVNAAAKCIQKIYRARVGRRRFAMVLQQHREKVAREEKAATTIQRIFRSYADREKLRVIFEEHQRRIRAATHLQKIFRSRYVMSWKELKFNLVKQQVEDRRRADEMKSELAVVTKNTERLAKAHQDSASEEEGEDEEDDWQEHWDYNENCPFYYSPSRGERSWEKPVAHEFEKSLVNCHVRVYWPHDQVWYTGTISRYNKSKKKHRIEYEDSDHEWLPLKEHEARVQIYDNTEQEWMMFKVCRMKYQMAAKEAQKQKEILNQMQLAGNMSEQLPSPWQIFEDPQTGLPYYYNTANGVTTWHIEDVYR